MYLLYTNTRTRRCSPRPSSELIGRVNYPTSSLAPLTNLGNFGTFRLPRKTRERYEDVSPNSRKENYTRIRNRAKRTNGIGHLREIDSMTTRVRWLQTYTLERYMYISVFQSPEKENMLCLRERWWSFWFAWISYASHALQLIFKFQLKYREVVIEYMYVANEFTE